LSPPASGSDARGERPPYLMGVGAAPRGAHGGDCIVRVWLPLIVLIGCTGRAKPEILVDPRRDTTWRVGVIAGSGDRTVTDIYTLRALPRPGGSWAFLTDDAEGTWEEGAGALSWSSAEPRPEDPWPIVLQHTISTVPAQIVLDATGRPDHFVDADAWRRAARSAVATLDLPPQASSSVEPLLDPQGLLRDLRRSLPGLPPAEGDWVREEPIAGLVVRRIERCTASRENGRSIYRCAGTLEPVEAVAALLHETRSTTVITLDHRGLVELDTGYDATLVYLDPSGERALDRAIAGQRKVVRQSR